MGRAAPLPLGCCCGRGVFLRRGVVSTNAHHVALRARGSPADRTPGGGRDLRRSLRPLAQECSPVDVPTWLWWTTIVVTVGFLLVDVLVIGRRPHEPSTREVSRDLALLHRRGRAVRDRRLDARRRRVRRGVLRRLADRVLALGRQPVHLHHHHDQAAGAPAVPADRAAGRHRHRAGDARASSSRSARPRSTSSAGCSTSSGCSWSGRRTSSPRTTTSTAASTTSRGSSGYAQTHLPVTDDVERREAVRARRTGSGSTRRCSSWCSRSA